MLLQILSWIIFLGSVLPLFLVYITLVLLRFIFFRLIFFLFFFFRIYVFFSFSILLSLFVSLGGLICMNFCALTSLCLVLPLLLVLFFGFFPFFLLLLFCHNLFCNFFGCFFCKFPCCFPCSFPCCFLLFLTPFCLLLTFLFLFVFNNYSVLCHCGLRRSNGRYTASLGWRLPCLILLTNFLIYFFFLHSVG